MAWKIFTKGFWTEWFSWIIKAPWYVRRKLRRKARVIEHVMPLMKNFIYGKIPKEVLKDHDIRAAEKDQVTLEKKGKKVEHAESGLGFGVEMEEVLSLRKIQEVLRMMIDFVKRHGPLAHVIKFAEHVLRLLGIARKETRGIYFQYLEPIIKVAEKTGDHKALMEKIRLMGAEQTTLMAAIALRLDIRASGKGLSKLKQDEKQLQVFLQAWEGHAKQRPEFEKRIEFALLNIEKDISVLHSDALVEKRDFLLTLLTLKYLDDAESQAQKYVEEVVMPKIPEALFIKGIEDLKKRLAEDMHELAQGMRIILATEKHAETLATELEAVAKQAVPAKAQVAYT